MKMLGWKFTISSSSKWKKKEKSISIASFTQYAKSRNLALFEQFDKNTNLSFLDKFGRSIFFITNHAETEDQRRIASKMFLELTERFEKTNGKGELYKIIGKPDIGGQTVFLSARSKKVYDIREWILKREIKVNIVS